MNLYIAIANMAASGGLFGSDKTRNGTEPTGRYPDKNRNGTEPTGRRRKKAKCYGCLCASDAVTPPSQCQGKLIIISLNLQIVCRIDRPFSRHFHPWGTRWWFLKAGVTSQVNSGCNQGKLYTIIVEAITAPVGVWKPGLSLTRCIQATSPWYPRWIHGG